MAWDRRLSGQQEMSQGHVIDIMTYNSYSLQYYSFGKEKTMRLDLTNHTSTKARPKNIKTNIKDGMGQAFVRPPTPFSRFMIIAKNKKGVSVVTHPLIFLKMIFVEFVKFVRSSNLENLVFRR